MGRVFTVDIDPPTTDYFMCKACETPVAAYDKFSFVHAESELNGALFHSDSVVNLAVDPPDQHRKISGSDNEIDHHTVADVHCVMCWDNLGYKYIEVGPMEYYAHKNMVKLRMEKLLLRFDDVIIDDVTDFLDDDDLLIHENSIMDETP